MARIGYGGSFGLLIAVVSLVGGGIFVYKSLSSVMMLRPDPPAEYFDVRPNWSTKERAAEERLARAYWETARRLSRTVHPFGTRLPSDPPAAFGVDPDEYPSVIEAPSAARARYWRNLYKIWNDPRAWKRVYEWHTSWFFQGTSY